MPRERCRDQRSGLRKSYGSYEAVRGIDFEVGAGEVFGFLGPNGAGKTTTIEILGHQHISFGDGLYWSITTMTTLGSNIYPMTTGGEIVSASILVIGIGFVALLTGDFAQRFLAPDIAEIEEELEDEQLSAEAVALRELRSVQEQLQTLEIAVEKTVGQRSS